LPHASSAQPDTHDLRSSRQLYKGQYIAHGALEETFSQELQGEQDNQSQSLKTIVSQISFASVFEVSRQSRLLPYAFPRVHLVKDLFFCSHPSFSKLFVILSPDQIKWVLSWKSCEYSDRCPVLQGLEERRDSKHFALNFQDFQFPIHCFGRLIFWMNISCYEVMLCLQYAIQFRNDLILEMSTLVTDMIQRKSKPLVTI